MGGSLTAVTLPSNVAGGASTTYNADNEQTAFNGTTFSYDANGNLLSDGSSAYTFDARNHLTGLTHHSLTTSFIYDAFGRRVNQSKSCSPTSCVAQYLYDGLNPVQELHRGGFNGPSTANMLTGLGIDEYFERTDTSGTFAYLADALGSTVGLVGTGGAISSSYTYQPFGATTVSGDQQEYQFTGRENDSTGLYYYRARYYSPTYQRFISQDPMDFAGGDLNLYGYALNSPSAFTDPFGLDIAIIEGGPASQTFPPNVFGHTAVAVTGKGVYSFGTGTQPGTGLATYLQYQATYRNSTVYVIHTTPAQDAAALASLRGQPHRMGPVELDNCSTRTNEALDAAGIPDLNMPVGGGEVPSATAPLLEGGVLPSSTGLRALQAGATAYEIPEGSTKLPEELRQFEPPVP